jgi:hypothetical protein
VDVLSGASSTTPTIPTPCRSPAGRLRRSGRPAPTARRCPRRSPALPPLPARRGYGCRLSTSVVEGTGVDPVQVCQGSYAPPPAPVVGTANRVTVRTASLPPARRGYGYGSGSAVVDGTAGVPVRPCQGSYAPVQAIGVVRHAGRRYGSAPAPPRRVGGTAMVQVAPWWTVRLACRYALVRVPTRRCRQSAWYGMPGNGTALSRPPCRIAFFEQQAQPKVHRTARGVASRPRRKMAPSAIH